MKILRLENASLSELVGIFLEITRGGIPTGSVVLISSLAHLQMRGLGGYVFDLAAEMDRLNKRFQRGVVVFPGVPIMMGGTKDQSAVRAVIELGRWFTHSGTQFLKKTWDLITDDLIMESEGGVFITEKL
jgi:hypothetical protein